MSVGDCGRMRGTGCPVQEREGRESSPGLTCPAAQSCPSSLLHVTQGWISSQHFTQAAPGLDIDFFPSLYP